jgi:TraY domain-containing protein
MTEDQAAKQQISVAVDAELRERLESAARRAERSLSGEAAFRLRRSFESARSDAA